MLGPKKRVRLCSHLLEELKRTAELQDVHVAAHEFQGATPAWQRWPWTTATHSR